MIAPRPATTRFLDRVGMPAPLAMGYLGVLLFMIGDGVESNYLAPYLVDFGFTEGSAATTISVYGIFVAIGSWLAGTLSAMFGPRRIMLLGGIVWVALELLFLAVAAPLGSPGLAAAAYALRGVAYPFFAYSFIVWITAGTPTHQLGTAVGWFWFVFGAGLPTLGSLAATASIPVIGEYGAFWVGTGLVVAGIVCAGWGVRDLSAAGPTSPEGSNLLYELVKGVTILWREPRVSAGAFVRLVNTAPNFALFVVAPFFFTQTVGFSQSTYLLIVTCVYTANIFANLFFGILGDRFGWRRTVTWFGCVMCAGGVLLLYYVPLAVGPNFWITILCWAVFGIGLSGFVPLTALMPAMVRQEDAGSSLAVYTLAAGLSAFIGPALVAALGGAANMEILIWTFAGLYLAAALLSLSLRSEVDPGEARRATETAPIS